MSTTLLNSVSGSQQTTSTLTEAGGLEMKTNIWFDTKNGSNLPEDNSYVLLQDKYKSLVQMIGGNLVLKSNADLYMGSMQNLFTTVGGDHQTVIQGDHHDYTKGDKTTATGEAGPKQVEAAKKLQEATHEIDKKKIDTIKKTKGGEVECPNCASEVLTDRGQCLIDEAIKIIRLAIPNFPYPLDVLEKILNFLGIPMSSPQPVKQLNGGKGCGSTGCKNGMVESPKEPIQKANQEAAKELESKQKDLEKHQKDMGAGGTQAMGPYMGDMAVHVGHPEAFNKAPVVALTKGGTTPFKLTNAKTTGDGFVPATDGNCEVAVFSDPLINPGSMFLGVAQKFTMSVGSPGIDIHTTGKAQLNAAVTTIAATEGELTLMSNNVTTLKGKNIIIDGGDRSGADGIRLDANNTMVGGALHVQGDLAVKGTISMDGGLHCTHITCPGERVSSGPSGAAHQVDLNAHWNNPITGLQASIYDKYDKAYKKISRDIFNFLSLNIANGMAEIKTLIEETYSSTMLDTFVDNMGQPTGFANTINSVVPGSPTGSPLLVGGLAHVISDYTGAPLPVIFEQTIVMPGQFLPVRTFTHNHGSAGGNHSHDYTSYQGHPVANNQSARGARPEPSHIPTPAKSTGVGSKPGHKSVGDLCIPCINPFGGANGKRNAKYGLPQDGNGFQGNNYVPVTALFDEQGNITPAPSIEIC